MFTRPVVLFLIFSFISTFALTNDEKAVQKTIEDETLSFSQNDFDKLSELWVHSPQAYYSISESFKHTEFLGWEAIASYLKEQMENFANPEWKPVKSDYQFRIVGNMAFVTFKENGNPSTRILEKQNNSWKILELSVVQIADPILPEDIAEKNWNIKLTDQSTPVYAMGTLTLNTNVDKIEFESFIKTEFNPIGSICIPGCKYVVIKSDRGKNTDKYLLLTSFESRYVRNLYWPEQNANGSNLFWAIWNASGAFKTVFDKFNSYITGWPEDWTDFIEL